MPEKNLKADKKPQDESPNSFIPKPQASRLGKWPFYAILLGAAIVIGVMIHGVQNSGSNNTNETAGIKPVDIQETEQPKPLLHGEGQGLNLAPQHSGVLKTDAEERAGKEPLIVVQKEQTPQPTPAEREAEEIRRMKAQAALEALKAPLAVKNGRNVNPQYSGQQTGQAAGAAYGYQPGPPYSNPYQAPYQSGQSQGPAMPAALASLNGMGGDPNAASDKEKEEFFSRNNKDANWIAPDTRLPGQKFEVKTGTVIPAVMVSGVNSDLPGNLIAQVSQNIYDTATGQHLILPQGSKLYGVYDSRVIYGQERVLIAWNRLIYPDGSAVTLGAMPGADMSGYAGFSDEVNNHYLRVFGSAFLMSMITGGTAYAMDSMHTAATASANGTTMQDEMISALSAQIGQASMNLLQKNLNIKPTLEIRPGYRFNVVITKDLVFGQAYTAWRK